MKGNLVPPDGYVTVRYIVARFGCSRATVADWIQRGLLPASKLSNGWYIIRTEDLDAFRPPRGAQSQKTVPPVAPDFEPQAVRVPAASPHLARGIYTCGQWAGMHEGVRMVRRYLESGLSATAAVEQAAGDVLRLFQTMVGE